MNDKLTDWYTTGAQESVMVCTYEGCSKRNRKIGIPEIFIIRLIWNSHRLKCHLFPIFRNNPDGDRHISSTGTAVRRYPLERSFRQGLWTNSCEQFVNQDDGCFHVMESFFFSGVFRWIHISSPVISLSKSSMLAWASPPGPTPLFVPPSPSLSGWHRCKALWNFKSLQLLIVS